MADAWKNGLPEAIARLREHLGGKPPPRFDARDKSALAFVLDTMAKPAKRWAVVFGNYSPSEVESTHDTREAAEDAAEKLNDEAEERGESGMWEIERL